MKARVISAVAAMIVVAGCSSAGPAITDSDPPPLAPVSSSPSAGGFSPTSGPAATSRTTTCAATDYSPDTASFGPSAAPAGISPLLKPDPAAVQVCRYAGASDSRPPGALSTAADADAEQAAALTAALNSSVPVDTSTWPPSCPTNSGAVYTETFSYNNQAPVMATTSLDGCAMTSVGTRAVWTSAATLGILAGILGDKPSANSVLLGPQPCQPANPNTRYCRGPSDRLVPRWH
jgi:hypothetical protein